MKKPKKKKVVKKADGSEFFGAIESRMLTIEYDYRDLVMECEEKVGTLEYWIGMVEVATEQIADDIEEFRNLLDENPGLYSEICDKLGKKYKGMY